MHHALPGRLQQQADFNGVIGHFAQARQVFKQAFDMDGDVAEVRPHVLVDEREVQTLQLLADFPHGANVTSQA
ncbi:hypothetical protein D3C84_1011360 [compost metagenome]